MASGANSGFAFIDGITGAVTTNGTADDMGYFHANSGQTLYYFNGDIRA
ncbi:MAG: hypothetical protein K5683_08335 [Prevotella sp.]|nr:hypothetical protein [Prevotella sp.]